MGRKRSDKTEEQQYEEHREASAARSAARSRAGRDIGEIPPVADPARRAEGEASFRRFCEVYFGSVFVLKWSSDHLKVIARIEDAVLRGGLFALAMPRGSGKALALDTPIPTPTGWTTMGEVAVGDVVYDERGKPCSVVAATQVMTGRKCYRVSFDDGDSVVCCEDHLWTVDDRFSRKNPLTLTTAQMASRVKLSSHRGWSEYRYTIPVAAPIEGHSQAWAVSPYMLGAWLGDGNTKSARLTIGDSDFREMRRLVERHESVETCNHKKAANAATYTISTGRSFASIDRFLDERRVLALATDGIPQAAIRQRTGLDRSTVGNIIHRSAGRSVALKDVSLQVRLRWLGVLNNKHIPADYLRANQEDRMDLLRGLMDTDGSVNPKGTNAEYVTKLPRLRDDVMELLASLGFKRRCRTKIVKGREYYRITFSPTDGRLVFDLPRKLNRQSTSKVRVSSTRRIVAIDPVDSVPVRCIEVDSPRHLYLCGRGMIPTHNSSLAEAACVWAVLCGHRRFVVLVGAEETSAESMLSSIKTELETNDLLQEDFPEACYPIARLEGIAHRCNGQLYQGERTHITWTAKELILPTIPGSKASGAILKVAGITGRIRGMKHKRPDGEAVRPELVIIDDPQTDDSARSRSQCQTRERILAGAILGLGGPGRKIAGVMPCTVIAPGDVADTVLDRQKHPEWQGVRTKLLYSFPTNMGLWERYGEMRAESFRAGGKGEEATEFYTANREAMDEGAVAAWPERHHPDELSAVQHCMNWWLTDPRAFAAEGQNEPLAEAAADAETMTAEEVADRVNGMARGLVPVGGTRVTAFIDVQASMLFWASVAWADDFTGWLLDYGTWPDQGVERFTLRDPRVTLADVFPSMGEEGRIQAALERLTADLCGRAWRRDDGAEVRVERLMVDAGYQADVVYQHCRASPFAAILLPSHGKYIGAESTPMDQYRKNQGDRVGPSWRIPVGSGRRSIRHAVFDSNHWKTFLFARLATALGDHGSLSLFGSKPAAHRLLSEHLTAEYRVRVSAKGREIDVWKLRTEKPDNHWFDCAVGCAVGASIQGVALAGMEARAALAGPRQRVSFAEMQRQKRGRR